MAFLGVICLAYPLRNPSSAPPRIELLQQALVPTLFISGTNDNMCNIAEMEGILKNIKAVNTFIKLEGGDHSFKAKKTNLYSYAELKKQQNEHVLEWINSFGDQKAKGSKREREEEAEEPGDDPTPSSPSKKSKQASLTTFFSSPQKEKKKK